MGRTVIVGDVHGCADELDCLLDRLAFAESDRLIFVGDLIARGPDSLRVLEIARICRAVIVRGNHEQKLLTWRRKMNAFDRGVGKRPDRLPRVHAKVASGMRAVDWTLLAATPLSYRLVEHGAIVVHAGIVPWLPIEEQEPETLMRIREVPAPHSRASRRETVLWGARYAGPPHVLFGHNALPEPQFHAWATGLDTSCVYGGRLTAMVLDEHEPVLRGKGARKQLVSVAAKKVYFAPTGRFRRVA